jgi:hypothetical protein
MTYITSIHTSIYYFNQSTVWFNSQSQSHALKSCSTPEIMAESVNNSTQASI